MLAGAFEPHPAGERANLTIVNTATGRVEGGAVRFEEPADWAEGQRVLIIALPPGEAFSTEAPPVDLLEEDAREFAPRPDLLAAMNRDELG